MRLRRSRLSAVLALVLTTAACSGGAGSTAHTVGHNPLDTVSVSGETAPAVTLATKPFSVSSTTSKVVSDGDGAPVTAGNSISANYLLVNGKDGKQIESSFGKAAASMDLTDTKLLPGLRTGLVGKKVGSRVLVAVPPAEAFGKTGNARIGVSGEDTVLFLVDVLSAKTPLTSATGTAVPPKAGLPSVVMGKDPKSPARITVPKTAPPTRTVVQPLVQGAGPALKAGQTLRFSFTGVVWKDGRVFDSSANTENGYASFPIGIGQVIPAWDKELVGKRVGSRLLLVVPPEDGYGAAGQPAVNISGTDTLVFVVDLLDAG